MFSKITTALSQAAWQSKVEEWVNAWLLEALEAVRLRRVVHFMSVAAKAKSLTLLQQIEKIELLEARILRLENALAWHKERVRVERREKRMLQHKYNNAMSILEYSWPWWLWSAIGCAVGVICAGTAAAIWGVDIIRRGIQ